MTDDELQALLNSTPSSDGTSGQTPGGKLREQLEAVLSERNQLKEQLAQVQQTQRAQALDSLFSKHGVPALARDLFPKDAEPTDEAVTSLVEKYGALWGAQAQPATTPPAEQQAAQQIQQFAQLAQTTSMQPLSEEGYRAMFAEAKTKDELFRLMGDLESTATGL